MAAECEESCQQKNFKCMLDCYGDSACASGCTRSFLNCIDDCPCHANCYDGCPCPNDNNFCELRCHDKYFEEYASCQNNQRRILLHCEEACGSFNPDCEHQCFLNYENAMKNCPCMENCTSN